MGCVRRSLAASTTTLESLGHSASTNGAAGPEVQAIVIKTEDARIHWGQN